MPLPPRELALWPLRAALSSGLASLLSLAQSTVFSSEAGSNVLSSPVFGTVVAIVCSTKTRGEVVGTAWGVLGGACMGCVLSALCAALFGPSLGAVLFSNALVGALVLYPRRFPVLAQKFAFGASTLMLWAVFEGADLRWSTLGVPICTAYGAACAILVASVVPCEADAAAKTAAETCAAKIGEALLASVAAFEASDALAVSDLASGETLRAKVDHARKGADAALADLRARAEDARWERDVGRALARLRAFACSSDLSAKKKKNTERTRNTSRREEEREEGERASAAAAAAVNLEPEAPADAFAAATLHVRGMTLALEALHEARVERWHLLDRDEDAPVADARAAPRGDEEKDGASEFAAATRAAASLAASAAAAAVVGDGNGRGGARVAEELRGALARLDVALTAERRKHYLPRAARAAAAETVARRALQANHLWVFNFQAACEALAGYHESASTPEAAADGKPADGDAALCDACEDPGEDATAARRLGDASETAPRRRGPSSSSSGDASSGDSIAAVLRCTFHADRDQLAYALKLSCACAVAGGVGFAVSGNGSWAALTVAMVGTREGAAVGGSFNAALLRMQGTVLGAMFSFALVTLIRGDLASGAGAARLILLAAFTFFTTYSRLNAEYAYAGVVAAFTAYVVALGIPSGADLADARGYAHRRVEQNLLGLVVLVFVELGVFPTFAHDATRLAAGETVASARVAAETVYDATVGTDCVRCRERAARDAGRTLEDVAAKLDAQKVLLVQAAAEPHLWSKPFPLEAHQRMATELEHVGRVLGLMRMALGAMAAETSRGVPLRHAAAETDGDSNEREGGEATGGEFLNLELDAGRRLRLDNPRAQVAALLAPTDGFVAALRRAVKARLAGAAADLSRGEARWATREASASIAKAQADLERAFVTHTLEIRERFRSGEEDYFLPNHLMVPWHAFVLCTKALASGVENLGAASWDALLAVGDPSKDEAEDAARGEKDEGGGGGEDAFDDDFLRGVRVDGGGGGDDDGRGGGGGGEGLGAAFKAPVRQPAAVTTAA